MEGYDSVEWEREDRVRESWNLEAEPRGSFAVSCVKGDVLRSQNVGIRAVSCV